MYVQIHMHLYVCMCMRVQLRTGVFVFAVCTSVRMSSCVSLAGMMLGRTGCSFRRCRYDCGFAVFLRWRPCDRGGCASFVKQLRKTLVVGRCRSQVAVSDW